MILPPCFTRPTLLSMIFFDSRNLLKHRRVPLWSFAVLWHKQIPTQNSDIPLLSLNFFEIRFLPKQRRTSRRSFLVLWDKKNFDRKLWYPILMLKIFPYPISSETQKRVHLRKVSVLWAKTISTDNLVTPTAPLHRNFDKRFFSNTEPFVFKVFC